MSNESDGQPFSKSNLDSPEYRERLLRKLNYLIAVLEVAIGKVRRSLTGPEPDEERLGRIKKNLQDTLNVCMRARVALERREKLPEGLPANLSEAAERTAQGASATRRRGQGVEMSSRAELRRFDSMGKIKSEEIDSCDLDELSRRLQKE